MFSALWYEVVNVCQRHIQTVIGSFFYKYYLTGDLRVDKAWEFESQTKLLSALNIFILLYVTRLLQMLTLLKKPII